MSITVDAVIKNFSNLIANDNYISTLNSNTLTNKVKMNNIKTDVFFLKQNSFFKEKKDRSFKSIFSNFVSDFILNNNSLLFSHKIKKKIHLNCYKKYIYNPNNIKGYIIFSSNFINLLKMKNFNSRNHFNIFLKNNEHTGWLIRTENPVFLNFLFGDHISDIAFNKELTNHQLHMFFPNININHFKNIELFKIFDGNILSIGNIRCENYKKYILTHSTVNKFLETQIKKWKKQSLHIVCNDCNHFHIQCGNSIELSKEILNVKRINENNFLFLQINFLKNNNFFQKEINNKLLNTIMNDFFLINCQKYIELLDIFFLKLTVNYKNKIAKLSIFSKDHELCLALKSSLIFLKDTFDKYDIKLKNIIIKNDDFCKNQNYNYNNQYINEILFFEKKLKTNKTIQKSTIDNKCYLQNKSFISNSIDIYA